MVCAVARADTVVSPHPFSCSNDRTNSKPIDACDRILKVSRTTLYQEGAVSIQSAYPSEAIQYRTLDRSL
jgi:predicted ATPase with chaperone activity